MPIMFALPLFMPYYAAIMIALILAFCCGYNNRPLSKLFLQRNFRNFVAEKRTLYDINEHRRIENDDKVHSKNKIRKRSNCNLRFKAAYFYNLLFVFIYFFVSAIALIASYYLQFSQSCGYLQQQRTSLNNKLDIVNVLYHCGAATSYTNIVYIMPKGKRLSKFKALDSKYQAFSAYRCYLGDVDVKAINDNNIQITTNCTQHIKHARLIGGVRTSLKSF